MDQTPPREIKVPKPEIKEVDHFVWQVPICCREGWESCPHVVKKQKTQSKTNIGL